MLTNIIALSVRSYVNAILKLAILGVGDVRWLCTIHVASVIISDAQDAPLLIICLKNDHSLPNRINFNLSLFLKFIFYPRFALH